MKSCAICGSHAFNMALEGVNQGAFCDRHYWQRKAESLEVARAASPKVPQGVEQYLAECEKCATIENNVLAFNMANYMRAYLSGMALVPVDDLEAIVEVVRGMLHAAYQNAMPVCCGKPGQQCCGSPGPEWNAADIEVMDSLGPVEKRISAMLAATKEKGE